MKHPELNLGIKIQITEKIGMIRTDNRELNPNTKIKITEPEHKIAMIDLKPSGLIKMQGGYQTHQVSMKI